MEKSVAFYSGTLRLETAYSSPYWTSFKVGGGQIALHGPGDPSLPQAVGGWVVSIVVEDIKQLRDVLHRDNVIIEGEAHDTPRGAVITFLDPDGNRIQAMQIGVKASEL